MTALTRLLCKVYVSLILITITTIATMSGVIALVCGVASRDKKQISISILVTCVAGALTFLLIIASIVVYRRTVRRHRQRGDVLFGYRRHDHLGTSEEVGILNWMKILKYALPSIWVLLAASHVGLCIWLFSLPTQKNIGKAAPYLGIPVYLSCGVSFFLTPSIVKPINLLSGNDRPVMQVHFQPGA